MGKRIDVILPEDLVSKLQREAGKRIGAKRGAFTEAITDAINIWLDPKVIELIEKNANIKLNQETREILKKYAGEEQNA